MKRHHERKPLKEVKLELARLGVSRFQLSQPEIHELTRVLFDDESIKAFVMGIYDGGYGMLVATNLRLLFVDVMAFGRVIIDDIPYTSINAIELRLGIFFGTVSVLARSRNYKFWWLNKDQSDDFNDYVERQMLKHHKEEIKVDR